MGVYIHRGVKFPPGILTQQGDTAGLSTAIFFKNPQFANFMVIIIQHFVIRILLIIKTNVFIKLLIETTYGLSERYSHISELQTRPQPPIPLSPQPPNPPMPLP